MGIDRVFTQCFFRERLHHEELCLFRLCPGERSASHLRKTNLPVEFVKALCLWKSAAVPAKTSRVSARVSRRKDGYPLLPDIWVSGKPFRTEKQLPVSWIVSLGRTHVSFPICFRRQLKCHK
jgi:hypothetical protein